MKTPFFFGDHLNLDRKRPFFFGDHLILTKIPPQSDSTLVKIWVRFVHCCFKLPKKPPSPLCEILATRLSSNLEMQVVTKPTSKKKSTQTMN